MLQYPSQQRSSQDPNALKHKTLLQMVVVCRTSGMALVGTRWGGGKGRRRYKGEVPLKHQKVFIDLFCPFINTSSGSQIALMVCLERPTLAWHSQTHTLQLYFASLMPSHVLHFLHFIHSLPLSYKDKSAWHLKKNQLTFFKGAEFHAAFDFLLGESHYFSLKKTLERFFGCLSPISILHPNSPAFNSKK